MPWSSLSSRDAVSEKTRRLPTARNEGHALLAAQSVDVPLAVALRSLYPVDWKREKLVALLANRDTVQRIERGETAGDIVKSWEKGLDEFLRRRAPFLLYPTR